MSGHEHAPPAGPTAARAPFRFSAFVRVGFDETDAQGVVYHGRYMPYFDRARVEYLRHLGLLRGGLPAGQEFVMRANHIVYEAPARFDDQLEVFIRVARIGTSSMQYAFEAVNAVSEELLTSADQTVVLIDASTRRPAPIPAAARAVIDRFEGRA